MDRRTLICGSAVLGAISCVLGWIVDDATWPLMTAAFFTGGVTTPLYALIVAYTNDYLSADDMPAASGGLVFTFGLGAIVGPLATGWAKGKLGPSAFWVVLGSTFMAIAGYALYRMTQSTSTPVNETESYLGVVPTSSAVAVEAAGEWASEQSELERETEQAS